ncbi:unnamed protein product, partial [Trichobilharzia szidati]
ESTFCSADDATVIFSGQDDRPLEMIIVQGDEKKYSLRNKAENRLIFTISHGNRFSLPKLGSISTTNSMQTASSLIGIIGVVVVISVSLIIIILYFLGIL